MRRSTAWWQIPLAAVAAGAWTAALLPEHNPTTWLLVPFSVLAGGLIPVFPLAAGLVLAIGNAAAAMIGLGFGEIEFMLPNIAVLFLLARHYRTLIPVALVGAGFSITALARTQPTLFQCALVLAFYSSMVLFGRLVRRRSIAAKRAVSETARLAELDIEELIKQSTRAQVALVTTESLMVIRRSVTRMRELAKQASENLDTSGMVAIRAEGERAINSLHALLSLLHEPKQLNHAPIGRTQRAINLAQRHRTMSAVLAAVVGSIVCVLVALHVAGPLPALLVLSAVSPFGVLLAQRMPLPASGAVAAAYVFTALGPRFHYDALPLIALCLALMIWQLVASLTLPAWLGVVVLAPAAALLGSHYESPGVGFIVAIVTITAVASWQWQQKDRVVLAEQVRSARLSATISSVRATAERNERLRVARELHDGLSYAITAMSLQAQAGMVQAEISPEAARHHLAVVQDVGTSALAEIDSVAASVQRSANRDDLNVWALLTEAHARGHTVSLELQDDFPPGTLAYRVVQEALTNAARYAPRAPVSISAGSRDDHWFVRVANVSAENVVNSESGHGMGLGLKGLAQRVQQLGGEFAAGPVEDGFEVHARWPTNAPTTSSLT